MYAGQLVHAPVQSKSPPIPQPITAAAFPPPEPEEAPLELDAPPAPVDDTPLEATVVALELPPMPPLPAAEALLETAAATAATPALAPPPDEAL